MGDDSREVSFFHVCWENLLTLTGLNLLFLLLCLPVITIPASTAALARSCQDILLGVGHPFRSFFHSFRKNLWAAVPAGVVLAGVPAGLVYGGVFYSHMVQESEIWLVCAIFCFVGSYVTFCAGAIGFQIIARVELSAAAVLRDAVLLLLQNPRLLFSWLLLAFLFPAVTLWFFPRSFPVLVLLPCALFSLAAARGTMGIICHQLVDEQDEH